MANPLQQFEVKTLIPLHVGGVDASFTNASMFMLFAVAGVATFLILSMRGRALVPTRWQSMAELSYEFIASMVRDNVGTEGRNYFPFVFSLFMFILFANLIGLLPYSFTFTIRQSPVDETGTRVEIIKCAEHIHPSITIRKHAIA